MTFSPRPYLCPFDPGMAKGLNYLELFLPTVVTRDDEISCGFQLWLDELLSIWDSNPNSPSWEQNLLWLLSRLAHDNIGLIDWSPWIPKIFTHLIKSFGLQGGALKVTPVYTLKLFPSYSRIIPKLFPNIPELFPLHSQK